MKCKKFLATLVAITLVLTLTGCRTWDAILTELGFQTDIPGTSTGTPSETANTASEKTEITPPETSAITTGTPESEPQPEAAPTQLFPENWEMHTYLFYSNTDRIRRVTGSIDYDGDPVQRINVSGVETFNTDKSYTVQLKFIRKAETETNNNATLVFGAPANKGYYDVTSSLPNFSYTDQSATANHPAMDAVYGYEGALNIIVFTVPNGVSEFTLDVHYRFADIYTSTERIGGYPREHITDDPRLYEIASQFETASDLLNWFHNNIRYASNQPVIPQSDIETLSSGRGDCDEMVILLISLGEKMQEPVIIRKLMGIDVSIVSGEGREGLIGSLGSGWHSIAMIRTDGQWIAFDPTEITTADRLGTRMFASVHLVSSGDIVFSPQCD